MTVGEALALIRADIRDIKSDITEMKADYRTVTAQVDQLTRLTEIAEALDVDRKSRHQGVAHVLTTAVDWAIRAVGVGVAILVATGVIHA
jgi:hypothetical protein